MALSSAINTALRTLQQAVVAATGTSAVNTAVGGLEVQALSVLQIVLTAIVSHAQNALENSGKIPTYLKPSLQDVADKIDAEVAAQVAHAVASIKNQQAAANVPVAPEPPQGG